MAFMLILGGYGVGKHHLKAEIVFYETFLCSIPVLVGLAAT
jgi:hypothetical protein